LIGEEIKKYLMLGDVVLPESNNMALPVIPANEMRMNLVHNLEKEDGHTLLIGAEVSESLKDEFSIERNQKHLRVQEKDADVDFYMRSVGSPEEYRNNENHKLELSQDWQPCDSKGAS
jgi:hypothetical protein